MFIVSPRIGLCNQLQTIVKGILLGIKYNRNIYIDRFQINLYNNNYCDINEILNINKINEYLVSNNINIKILNEIDIDIINNIDAYKLSNIDYDNIPYTKYINNYIEENLSNNIIYLGNIVSLCIYQTFNYTYNDYTNLYHLLMSNLIFHDKFYKIKNMIKNNLNLINYTTIHLRIEDDAIKYFSSCYNLSLECYNNKLLSFYDENIKNIKNSTYICSGILTYDNKINYNYYIDLMKNNSLLCDKKNINIESYYLDNRELIAIIDLLIAYDSDIFIGSQISSFSIVVNTYFKTKKNVETNLFIPN